VNKKVYYTLSSLIIIVLYVGSTISPAVNLQTNEYCRTNNESSLGYYIEDEIIIKFKEETQIITKTVGKNVVTGIKSIDVLNEKYEIASAKKVFEYSIKTSFSNIYLFKYSKNVDILTVINEYKNNPNVEYAQPNYLYYAQWEPNDPLWAEQWGQQMIYCEKAWDVERGDSDIIIAILDSGVFYHHVDFADKIWPNPNEKEDGRDNDGNGYVDDLIGWDFINDDNDPADDHNYSDCRGHGTGCAGVAAAATNNGIGVAGAAPNVKIMPIKVLNKYTGWGGAGGTNVVINGLRYAMDNGADIVSMSFGGPADWYPHVPDDILFKELCNEAYNDGLLLFASAGNGDTAVRYPANWDPVIAVGALDQTKQRASFSNKGSELELMAPGVDIITTIIDYTGENDKYGAQTGTSFACPMAAGVAALYMSRYPEFNNIQIRELLKNTAEDLGDLGWDKFYGFGMVNASAVVSLPPEKPTILGPETGSSTKEYEYTFKSVDPTHEQVEYYVDWGDGNKTGWFGPFSSGTLVGKEHKWEQGCYEIKAKARDINKIESKWSDSFAVNMSKSKEINKPMFNLFKKYINFFSIMEKLLNHIL
jgi:subtilisin family serine protease